MRPGAEFQDGGKPGIRLLVIIPELCFGDHKRRVLEAKIDAVFIAELLIAWRSRSGRIAIEHRSEHRYVLVGIDFHPCARRRERISRPAAWKSRRGNRWPVGLQEHERSISVEELNVGCELTGAKARAAIPKTLLQP